MAGRESALVQHFPKVLARAAGGTALYAATESAYKVAQARARQNPGRIHAVMVMTDGNDESSTMTLAQLKEELVSSDEQDAAVRVFTIAYGEGVEGRVLEQIAEVGKGSSAKGSVEDIVQVYRDMASFF